MAASRRAAAVTDLAKTYDPQATEARWQQSWESSGAFHPDPKAEGEPFSVVIPPPNVTGSLHMGHAFNTALIDTIVRFQRLQGKNVLCLPGTDHASIAVQTILEKQLKAVSGSDPQGYAKKKQLQAEKAKLLKEKRGLAAAKAAEGAAA